PILRKLTQYIIRFFSGDFFKAGDYRAVYSSSGADVTYGNIHLTVSGNGAPASGLSVPRTRITIRKGEEKQLTAQVLPADGEDVQYVAQTVQWAVRHRDIASVSSELSNQPVTIKGLSVGSTVINARSVTGDYIKEIDLTVLPEDAEGQKATVTFKVVNGSWNDGTADDKTITLTSYNGETLKLVDLEIPAVGSKPKDENYKGGSWDTVPSAETVFEKDTATTYTYSYNLISQAAPTGLKPIYVSAENADDGGIRGVTDAMEYSSNYVPSTNAGDWTPVFVTKEEGKADKQTGLTAGTYYVRNKAIDKDDLKRSASNPVAIEVKVKDTQAAPVGLSVEGVSSAESSNGKVKGVTEAMEYAQKAGADAYSDYKSVASGVTEITGLANDTTVKVRYKATDTFKASPDAELTIGLANPLHAIKGKDYLGVYDRKEHTIALLNVPAGAKVKYGASPASYSDDNPDTLKAAGEKTIYWKAELENTSGDPYSYTGSNTITIVPKSLTAKAEDQAITKGGSIRADAIAYSGALAGDTVTVSGGNVVVYDKNGGMVSSDQVAELDKGTYTLMVDENSSFTTDNENYKVSAETESGVLTVLPAPDAGKTTVSYDSGEGIGDPQDYANGATLPRPSNPAREGYTFTNWMFLKNGTKTSWDFGKTIKDNLGIADNAQGFVTLTAEWEPIGYTATLELGGGRVSGQDAGRVSYPYNVENALSLPIPVRDGYTFTGWTGTGLAGKTIAVKIPKGSIGNRSYTASWSSNAENGTPVGEATMTVEEGVITNISTDEALTEDAVDGLLESEAAVLAAAVNAEKQGNANEVIVSISAKAVNDGNTDNQKEIKKKALEAFNGGDIKAEQIQTDFIEISVSETQSEVEYDENGKETGRIIVKEGKEITDTSSSYGKALALKPFIYELSGGLHHPSVFRYHEGSVQKFRQLASKPVNGEYEDGTVYFEQLDKERVVVYLYSSLFSTFGITSLSSDVEVQSITINGEVYNAVEGQEIEEPEVKSEYDHWEDQAGNKVEFPLEIGEGTKGLVSINPVYKEKSNEGDNTDDDEPTFADYTVSFNLNGHGSPVPSQTVTEGGKATKPADPAAEGFAFGGWHTDAACTKEYDFDTFVTADITLYAKWTEGFTVSFDLNGKEGAAPEPQKVEKGKTAEKPTDPTAEGFLFEGWHTDSECTAEYDFRTPVTQNTTLYAKWAEGFTVSFDLNGVEGTAPETQKLEKGKAAEKPADPAAEGFVFGGWYTEPACETEYDFGTAVTASATLYAKWTAASGFHVVAFNLNGHGTAVASQSVKDGQAAKEPEAPVAEGFTFGGWYTEAECTSAYNFDTSVTADITLYAKWTEKADEEKETFT
ncbi:MAG: InlB B-repeat-containing protein, partial [Lachnospiraceae bacterium]|nr:InlB B-repeat-containing protein [Lachnospiraceae bacterium]